MAARRQPTGLDRLVVANAWVQGVFFAGFPDALTLDEVADAGLDSIEHIDYAFKAGSPDEKDIGVAVQRKQITDAEAWARREAGFE